MGLCQRLAQEAGIGIVDREGLELVALKDVEAFLKVALQQKQTVLGFEGFYLTENHVVPDMRVIADYSSGFEEELNPALASHQEALRLIQKIGMPEMYFEFVFSGEV